MPASIQAFVFRLFSSQFSHTHEVPGKKQMRKKLSQTKLLHFNQIVDGEWERRELNWSDLYTFDCVPIPQKREKLSIIVYWHAMRCGFEKFQEENQTFVWRLK